MELIKPLPPDNTAGQQQLSTWARIKRFYSPPRESAATHIPLHERWIFYRWTCPNCKITFDMSKLYGGPNDFLRVQLFGPAGVGKTTYIQSLIHGGSEGFLTVRDGGGDTLPAPYGQEVQRTGNVDVYQQIEYRPQIELAPRQPASNPAARQEDLKQPRVFILNTKLESADKANYDDIALYDSPGEVFNNRRDPDGHDSTVTKLFNSSPGFSRANFFILCLDARHIMAPKDLPQGMTPQELVPPDFPPLAIRGLAQSRVLHKEWKAGRKADCHLAVVVLKADKLHADKPSIPNPPPGIQNEDLMSQFSYAYQTSRATRAWVQRHCPELVKEAETWYESVSFHLVSSTGCDADATTHLYNNGKPTPTRVFDPFAYYLALCLLPQAAGTK